MILDTDKSGFVYDELKVLRLMNRLFFNLPKKLHENRGAENIEWIAIVAILMVLLFALNSVLGQHSPEYASDISETVGYYTGLWVGEDSRATGASAGDSFNAEPESGEEGRGFWDHVKGAAYGFFVDGIYETGKGLLVLGKDLVVMAPITGDLIDWVVPGIQGETREKYAQLIEAIADNPSAAAQAMVQPMIDAWNDEDYGRLIGMGLFEAAAIFIPGDEVGKIGWVTRIDRAIPDEILASITRIEKMELDELVDVARRGDILAPEEMSAIRRRLDEMTPEQRSQYDELVKLPCLIANAPTKRPPGLASMVLVPAAAKKPCNVTYQPLGGFTRDVLTKGFHVNSEIGELSLIPKRLSDGTIQIVVQKSGVKTGSITDKVVDGVSNLLSSNPDGALKRAQSIIDQFGHDPKYVNRVAEAELLIEALTEGGVYTIIR